MLTLYAQASKCAVYKAQDRTEYAGLSMGHIYLSDSHPIAIYACPIPWDVSHGIPNRNDIPMDKPRVVHGTYLSVPFPSHSNLCLSHPMGRFPWDSHRNDIPMDKPENTDCQKVLLISSVSYFNLEG